MEQAKHVKSISRGEQIARVQALLLAGKVVGVFICKDNIKVSLEGEEIRIVRMDEEHTDSS